jgi:Flp pilus assembly protein TadD
VENLQAALDLEPDRAETWSELATARLKQGDAVAARAAAEQALRLKPRFPAVLYLLGNIEAAGTNFAGAIARYRQVLELVPEHLAARNNLANALLVTGRIDEAIAQYQQILQQRPDDRSVRENLARALELKR